MNQLYKRTSDWMKNYLSPMLKKDKLDYGQCPISPESFATLVSMVHEEIMTTKEGRLCLKEMYKNPDIHPMVWLIKSWIKELETT